MNTFKKVFFNYFDKLSCQQNVSNSSVLNFHIQGCHPWTKKISNDRKTKILRNFPTADAIV